MLLVGGSRVCYRTIGRGEFHCERCGGDRLYWHRSGRRWAHVLGIPVLSLGGTGEHLCCVSCGTCYRVDLLAVPTTAQMEDALLAATTAAVLAMLRAGGATGAARRRGIAAIRSAGSTDFNEARLKAALSSPVHPSGALAGPAIARHLGMTQSQARTVISLLEEAAQAG